MEKFNTLLNKFISEFNPNSIKSQKYKLLHHDCLMQITSISFIRSFIQLCINDHEINTDSEFVGRYHLYRYVFFNSVFTSFLTADIASDKIISDILLNLELNEHNFGNCIHLFQDYINSFPLIKTWFSNKLNSFRSFEIKCYLKIIKIDSDIEIEKDKFIIRKISSQPKTKSFDLEKSYIFFE